MRTDPLRNLWAGRGRIACCTVWAVVLLLSLPRCHIEGDTYALCLKNHDDPADCCLPTWHKDLATCCPNGEHALCDITHPDWCICKPDEDAGIDAETDAGIDAALDAGTDAP